VVSALGDPDLSPPERASDPDTVLSGRGLVVFPAPAPARQQGLLTRFAPFLITVALGAVLVVAVALVS
jgi:hypothetical protein